MSVNKREIAISTDFIRLDALLKLAGLADTGGQAKLLIQSGRIRVNGEVCLQWGRKIRGGDRVGDLEETTEVTVKEG